MSLSGTPWIWFNGAMVPWEDAQVHVMTYGLHMGAAVFEGIRLYRTPQGPALFRLQAHVTRFLDSARIYQMELPLERARLVDACHAVVRRNALESAYLRPLAWLGVGSLGTNPLGHPVEVMVAAVHWGAYHGTAGLENGIDVGVSSWRRVAPDTIPTLAKVAGTYLSSQLIALEAHRNGFAEGIALDAAGQVSEGSAANLFLVRDGTIYTPPISASVLPGVTRDAVITLARGLGLTVSEQAIPREMLYVADELFFTGTAAEITPIRSVDRVPTRSASPGPVTRLLQQSFFGLFDGSTADVHDWLEYVLPDQDVAGEPPHGPPLSLPALATT